MTRPRLAFGVFAAFVFLTPAASAQVPGEEIARHAFEDGVELEKKGDYSAALDKFRESMAIKATLGNRFHVAFCLEMTGKLAAALTEYETVDKAAREQNKADVVEATRVRMEPLRARVPQLALKGASGLPEGAEVQLDGQPVATALLDGKSFRVDPGEHTVSARAPGRAPFTRSITLAEGESAAVDVVLAPIAERPPAPAVTEPPAEEPKRPARTAAIVTTAAAAALVGGGVAAFLVADGTHSDALEQCTSRPSCEDERDKVRTFDALALGAFIGAAGLGALSIVFWTSKPAATAARPAASVVARPSWLGVEGRF